MNFRFSNFVYGRATHFNLVSDKPVLVTSKPALVSGKPVLVSSKPFLIPGKPALVSDNQSSYRSLALRRTLVSRRSSTARSMGFICYNWDASWDCFDSSGCTSIRDLHVYVYIYKNTKYTKVFGFIYLYIYIYVLQILYMAGPHILT